MIDALTGLGFGIIGLAVMIGIGIVILTTLGNNIGAGSANNTVQTLAGYLGTSNGGLASWVPIIIVLVIGMLFLGYFVQRQGRKN